MNQDIYFPIKSNLGFFEQKSDQPNLISKIKQSILLYDNLHFDAGAYYMSCSDRGSFHNYHHPDLIGNLDLDVPDSPHTGFYVSIAAEPNGKPVMAIPPSKNDKNYIVCFQRVIEEMNLNQEKFIKFWIPELDSETKKLLKDRIWYSRQYKDLIDSYEFCKNVIFENFHFSLLSSEIVNTPIMIDNFHDVLIKNINEDLVKKADYRLNIFKRINNLLKFVIPDFSLLETDELLDLRKDKLFDNFRNTILKINEKMSLDDEEIIESFFIQELIQETKEFAPSDKKLAINGGLMLLGLLPYVGNSASLVAYMKEVNDFSNFENTCTAFIMKYI